MNGSDPEQQQGHQPPQQVINLRVTANSVQGHRKYMEDCYKIRFQREKNRSASGRQDTGDPQSDILFSYFGIFDGHGGKEASQFAKERLYWKIVELDDFWSDDDKKVLGAIRNGFVQCHMDMWNELPKWPKTASGLPSTSGSTATVLFIKKSKAYVGHVGDSGLVIGYAKTGAYEGSAKSWRGEKLTRDHKPEDPIELKRIESCGGSVINKSGINRVVWNRPILNARKSSAIPNSNSTGHMNGNGSGQSSSSSSATPQVPTEKIPFLAVARSLGDLWSYDRLHDEFVVSPVPDVFSFEINPRIHKCLILATDGLWNVMRPNECIEQVRQTDKETENLTMRTSTSASNAAAIANSTMHVQPFVNPSQRLVQAAFQRCCEKSLRSDNITCITIMIDEPQSTVVATSVGEIKSSNKNLERLMQNRTASLDADSDGEENGGGGGGYLEDEITISNDNDCTKMTKTFTEEFGTPSMDSEKRSRSMISLRRRRWSASSARSVSTTIGGQRATEQPAKPAPTRTFVNSDDRAQNRLFVGSRREQKLLNSSGSMPSLKVVAAPPDGSRSRKAALPAEPAAAAYTGRYAPRSTFTTMNLNSTSISVNLRRRQHQQENAAKKSLNVSSASAINKLSKNLRKSLNDIYKPSHRTTDESKENKGGQQQQLNQTVSVANKCVKRLKGFKDRIIQTKNNLFNRKRKHDSAEKPAASSTSSKMAGARKSKSAYEFGESMYKYRDRANEEDEEEDEVDDYEEEEEEDEEEENHYEEPEFNDKTTSGGNKNQSFVEHFKSKLGYLKRPRVATATTTTGANKSCSNLENAQMMMTRSATAAIAKSGESMAAYSKRPKFY